MENQNPYQKTLYAPKKKLKVDIGDDNRLKPWLWGILAVAGLYSAVVVIGVMIFGLGIRSGLNNVQIARDEATDFNFQSAIEFLDEAQVDFRRANAGLFVLNIVKPIPFLGQQVRGMEAIMSASVQGIDVLIGGLQIGDSVLTSSAELTALLEEGAEFSFYDLPGETRANILMTISRSASTLEDMRARVRLVRRELNSLQRLAVAPQIMNIVSPVQSILPDLESSINFFIPLASSIEQIGGVHQPKQWLVLFLNNSELRPAGGFIGVYGLLEADNGEIISFEVSDVYEADGLVEGSTEYFVPPPKPLVDYLGVWRWLFRDANWSPDFPSSADTARQLLRQQQAYAGVPVAQIDGIIGLTPVVAERVLEYLGPVEIDGFVFNSDNVYDLLQFETQFGFAERGLSTDDRKLLISKLTDEVMNRLMTLPLSELPGLFEIALKSFEDKHLAIRSLDESTHRILESAGWTQSVSAPRNSDVLMVVDANLAALKTDPVVDRKISYSVRQEAGRSVARVDIDYIHRGTFTGLTTRYRTFTRVFAPLGSELRRVEGHLRDDALNNPQREPGYVLTETDLGMTSFGAFTSVEPGRIHRLSFEYYLPSQIEDLVANDRYQLKVFKQMGADDYPLTLDIDFGKNIRNANPPEPRSKRGDSAYEVEQVLNRDLNFTVLY